MMRAKKKTVCDNTEMRRHEPTEIRKEKQNFKDEYDQNEHYVFCDEEPCNKHGLKQTPKTSKCHCF